MLTHGQTIRNCHTFTVMLTMVSGPDNARKKFSLP